MLRNYLTITFRTLLKNKVYSLINISGLAIGISCCLLIILYIQDERSYDTHHNQAWDIYRVATQMTYGGNHSRMATSPAPLAFTLKQDFPEIVQATRLISPPDKQQQIVVYNNKTYFESDVFLTDSTFFTIFKYNFIAGNPQTALREPNSVVISEPMAKKIFGAENPLNALITIGENDYTVTGIFTPAASPSHIKGNFFTSIYSKGLGEYVASIKDFVGGNFIYTYIKLHPDADTKALEAKFPAFLEKYAGNQMKEAGITKSHFLQAVPDIHLYSSLEHEAVAGGGITYIYILSSIAAFILLIACINFMNLSTAKSGKRAKEVGVRKILGAYRSTLLTQFLGESIILSSISIVFSLGLIVFFLPVFNELTGKHLSLTGSLRITTVLWIFAMALITGVLAGSYPALYLSAFQPIKVLKGLMVNHFAANILRRGLVVFQFVISVCLIVGTITILSQLNYIQQQNLGFAKEQRIVIPLRTQQAREVYQAFRNDITNQPAIRSVAGTSSYPGEFYAFDSNFVPAGKRLDEATNCKVNLVEPGLIETMEYKLIAGRSFTPNRYEADKEKAVILNEAAALHMGWKPEEAIGKKISSEWGGNLSLEVIGVLKNFNYESLYKEVRPMIFMAEESSSYAFVIVHAKPDNWQNLLESMEQSWKKYNASLPFEYTFLNDQVNQQYEADQRLSRTITYLTGIAIFISCLGLYGLTTFTAEQRIKEIGVRKVLGASVTDITALLSKGFLKPVLIGNLIAWPIAYYGMNQWLEDFAYRINMHPWIFGLAGLVTLIIALLTVGYQSVKAALVNPVKSLRSE